MDIIARARYIRHSPRKVRLVASAVANMPPQDAIRQLTMTPKFAAKAIKDVLESAIANAQHNHNIAVDQLRIATLEVGEGPTLKRSMPRSKGMANPIMKRTSHIRIVLTDAPAVQKKTAQVASPRRHRGREATSHGS